MRQYYGLGLLWFLGVCSGGAFGDYLEGEVSSGVFLFMLPVSAFMAFLVKEGAFE